MRQHADVLLPAVALAAVWGLAQALPIAQLRLLTEFLILTALALNWNLLAGYAGLISVGQQAYVGIGAYALYAGAALMGWPLLASVVLAAAVAALFALLIFPLLFRLRGPQFAIGSWQWPIPKNWAQAPASACQSISPAPWVKRGPNARCSSSSLCWPWPHWP